MDWVKLFVYGFCVQVAAAPFMLPCAVIYFSSLQAPATSIRQHLFVSLAFHTILSVWNCFSSILELGWKMDVESQLRVSTVPLTIPNVWIGKYGHHWVWAKGGIQNRIEHQAPRLHLSNIETQRSRIVNRKKGFSHQTMDPLYSSSR